MATWVKNPTAVARFGVESWVPSTALCSRLKDPPLLQLQCRLQLWLRFSLAWELPYVMGMDIKEKKKKNSI